MTPHPRTLAARCGRGPAAHRMHQRPHPGSQRHPRPLGIGVRHGKCQPDSVGVTLLDPVRGQAAGRRRGHRTSILAREQMFYDLLADPEPYLNDINDVAAQPQLDIDLRNLQQTRGRRRDRRSSPPAQ